MAGPKQLRAGDFLTGKEPEIRSLAQTVGFGYRFDPATRQYAHPSGIVILTAQGKVAKYMFGATFASRELYESLRTAGANQIASPVQRLILLCFHYNPWTGLTQAREHHGADSDFQCSDGLRIGGLNDLRGAAALNRHEFSHPPTGGVESGRANDLLYWGFIILSLVVVVIVFCPILYFLFKYREGKPADRSPVRLPQNTIEITWTLIPLLIMICFYVWGAKHYFVIERPPAGAYGDQRGRQTMDVENPAP